MRFAASAQKFEVVSESHWFLYRFVILSRVIVINACLHTYALDSTFLFLPLERNNFWTVGPIFAPKVPVDLSEKTLHFGHQFFIFILKIVWDMA